MFLEFHQLMLNGGSLRIVLLAGRGFLGKAENSEHQAQRASGTQLATL
jgi:hypothetical protein